MDKEKELLKRHLTAMLELLEDPEFSPANLRAWQNLWWWDDHSSYEIFQRLSRIERRLEDASISRCALSSEQNESGVMRLITGMEDRLSEERKYLTSWLKGCEDITIVDPYFFSFGGPNKVFRTLSNYTNWLEKELVPSSAAQLTIFHLPGPNGRVINSFKNFCKRKNIKLTHHSTNEIHDRVIIKNGEIGRALGTSFGGLGNKIAFMLDLPHEDLHAFKRELHRIAHLER